MTTMIASVIAVLVIAYLIFLGIIDEREIKRRVADLEERITNLVESLVLPCGEIDPHGSELCWMRQGHGGPHRAQSGLAFATEHRKALAASKAQTPLESNPGGVETASPEAM